MTTVSRFFEDGLYESYLDGLSLPAAGTRFVQTRDMQTRDMQTMAS